MAGMHHLVIHAEHEDVVEVAQHQLAQLGHALTVDVARLRGRRRVGLALQRWHADDRRAMLGQRGKAVASGKRAPTSVRYAREHRAQTDRQTFPAPVRRAGRAQKHQTANAAASVGGRLR